MQRDWISLHYSGKSGEIFIEEKAIGDFLIKNIGAVYVDKLKTTIGTYYKYRVTDLANAYYAIYAAWRYIGY